MKHTIRKQLPSPCWVLDEKRLLANAKILYDVKQRSGAKILLALKGYALWQSFDTLRPYLDGCCASGLHEAMLAAETFKKEVHTYAPAFKQEEIETIARISHHLVFNSPDQFRRFAPLAKTVNSDISLGLRINPEVSQAPKAIYNPCAPFSRLGTTRENFDENLIDRLDGLHLHALCEQDSDAFEAVLKAFEAKFGDIIPRMKWINFGGGHHITRQGYDIDRLVKLLQEFKRRYGDIELYLEPGEAVGWETGVLVATVLDIVHNGMPIAVLDTSAEAHMPDTIIMPYRAQVRGAGEAGEKAYTYRLAGNTCLAGDIMGDYSFDKPLRIGDTIIFEDQMHYTMVKATTFNGIKLPSIAIVRSNGEVETVREFDYEDFKSRLS